MKQPFIRKRPVASIVSSLGALSRRWLRRSDPFRKKAVGRLVKVSGFLERMAEEAVDSIFSALTAGALERLLRAELRDPKVLDGFRRDPVTGRHRRAAGPRLITHIFPANAPNPAVTSFVLGMLVKSVNVGKLSSRDDGILGLYLDSLREWDAGLAKTNHLVAPEDRRSLRKWLALSELVVAYGRRQTLEEIKKLVPAGTLFFEYGPRTSFGLVTRAALGRTRASSLARRAARDVWMLDQRGCLSPATFYVQMGGQVAPRAFAGMLAHELERICRRQKGPSRGFSRIADLDNVRGLYRVRRLKDPSARFWESAVQGAWAVLYEERLDFRPASGGQIVHVKGFRDLKEVYAAILPARKYLQAVSLECAAAEKFKISGALADLGVNRLARAGSMQTPPVTWHHDGRFNLASWLYWTDLEF